jgi:hypothetical protein
MLAAKGCIASGQLLLLLEKNFSPSTFFLPLIDGI